MRGTKYSTLKGTAGRPLIASLVLRHFSPKGEETCDNTENFS